MKMHNPPHPGEFIKEVYIEELHISERVIAQKLNVSPSTLNRLINAKSSLTPEMAIRLSITRSGGVNHIKSVQHPVSASSNS